MISDSSGISLNIAALPVTRKKAKGKTTSDGFSKGGGIPFTETKKPTAVGPKVPPKPSAPVVSKPTGILKTPKAAAAAPSIWKKFKSANKKDGAVEPSFVKSVSKPERLVRKKVKVKDAAGIIPSPDVSYEWHKSRVKKTGSLSGGNTQKSKFKFLDSDTVKPIVESKKIRFSSDEPVLISDSVVDVEEPRKQKSKLRFSNDKPVFEETEGRHNVFELHKNKVKRSESLSGENTQKSKFKFLSPDSVKAVVEGEAKKIRFSSEEPDTLGDVEKPKKRKSRLRFSEDKPESVSEESKGRHNTGKSSSLFGNNPEIPSIPHRAVRPIKEAVFSSSNFEDLELHPYMVKYLKESMGLTKMTTVQEKSIPILLKKQDALIKSQTGSGKTLAFALPILHNLQEIRPKINRADGVLVLIVVPTRELALQVYEVFNKLVKSYTWIVPGYLVGGEKRKSEKARLRKGISILIGTPGRLIDHVQHTKALSLEKVSYLVIDEADRLLDMGYEKDVSVLLDALNQDESKLLKPGYLNPEEEPKEKKQPKDRQTILLSATLTAKVEKLAGLSMKNPVFVDACDENLTPAGHVPVFSSDVGDDVSAMVLPENLVQKYVVTPPKLKLVSLASFILQKSKQTTQKKMLIFIATQDMVDYYTELLSSIFSPSTGEDSDSDTEEDSSPFSNSGIELFKLHGNMKQTERTEVFKTFRQSHFGVLLCTDVASRGLDLPEVDWVIQYTGPTSVSDYVHRVGRTARGGQSGSSIIILTPNEVSFIGKLENCQIRLQEEKMESCLEQLMTFGQRGRSLQEEATSLQLKFENMVTQKKDLYDLGCKAFASWSRFYASYPRNMRDAFSVKGIHQGHYAKSFALRDTPSAIVNYARKKNLNEERLPRKRPREWRDAQEKPAGVRKGRSRLAEVSEFDSGLEPSKKKKKKL